MTGKMFLQLRQGRFVADLSAHTLPWPRPSDMEWLQMGEIGYFLAFGYKTDKNG
jgi:hypothetical protein